MIPLTELVIYLLSSPSSPPLSLIAEEIQKLHKSLESFAFEISQKQVGLDTALRDRTNQLNKTVEVERMHIQMKEAMSADISYLRRLNLQLVEAQMKGEGAWSRVM